MSFPPQNRLRNALPLMRIVLGAFLLTAGNVGATECPNSAELRAQVQAFVDRFPTTPYSWRGFSRPVSNGNQYANFSFSTELKDLVDDKGNMILFRNIARPYKPRFEGEYDRNYIHSEGGLYSYSLSPSIVKDWANNEEGKVRCPGSHPDGNCLIGQSAVTLIAVQNLAQDLRYKNYEARMRKEYEGPLRHDRLFPGFRPSLNVYDEVKVPISQENVLLSISQRRFADILDTFGGRGRTFTIQDFMRKVLDDASVQYPNCKALLALPKAGCAAMYGHLKQ